MEYILLFVSYLLGSIPFGIVVTKIFTDIEITKEGSHNIGASNVKRVAGTKLGLLTLFFDMLKGFVPTLIASYINSDIYFILLTGFFAFIGHLYSLFLKFKGGKGVATAAGVYLAVAPLPFLLSLAVYILTMAIVKIASVSSLFATLSIPLFLYLFKMPYEYLVFSIVVTILIFYAHKDNFKRLIKGKEPTII